jgi:hypothetical protein
MKTCTGCQETKNLTDFSFRNKAKDLLAARCKSCHAKYAKKHYEANSDDYKARAVASNRVSRKKNREWIRELKRKSGCRYCDESEPVALDFHHVEKKIENIAILASRNVGRQKLESEVRKCIVICANCHRKLHAGLLPA